MTKALLTELHSALSPLPFRPARIPHRFSFQSGFPTLTIHAVKKLIASLVATTSLVVSIQAEEPKLKALLLIGGCCHEYDQQLEVLKAGLGERLDLDLTVEFNPKDDRDVRFDTVTNGLEVAVGKALMAVVNEAQG